MPGHASTAVFEVILSWNVNAGTLTGSIDMCLLTLILVSLLEVKERVIGYIHNAYKYPKRKTTASAITMENSAARCKKSWSHPYGRDM